MTLTVSNLIKDAMGLIGALRIDEDPDTSEYSTALRTLNIMLGGWATRRLLLRSQNTLTIPLVVGQAGYTVGSSGADITSGKVIKVTGGRIKDSTDMEYNLDQIDKSQYDTFQDKNISQSRPTYVANDPGAAQQSAQKSTIYFYPTPDTSYTAYVDVDQYFTEFATVGETVTFEPAYYEPLVYNLAVRLFRHFRDANTPVPQDIAVIASNSLQALRNMNATRVLSYIDIPGAIGSYNIYTDQG